MCIATILSRRLAVLCDCTVLETHEWWRSDDARRLTLIVSHWGQISHVVQDVVHCWDTCLSHATVGGGGGVTRCLHVRADKGTREGVRGFTQSHAGGVRGGIRTSLTWTRQPQSRDSPRDIHREVNGAHVCVLETVSPWPVIDVHATGSRGTGVSAQ